MKIIETIASRKRGLQRTELAEKTGVADGEGLTKALRELEQCGFIRQYKNIAASKNGSFYQVIDPFVISSNGCKQNEYSDVIQNVIEPDSLFLNNPSL